MGIDTKCPVRCPIDGNEIDMDECFVRCSAAVCGCPEFDMPGIRSFEEEVKVCKSCKYHVDE